MQPRSFSPITTASAPCGLGAWGVPAAGLALVSLLQRSLYAYFPQVKRIRADEWG